ncbi:MAG: energy-coupling factor ABC transporter substrate-binding protein [Desulfurispora sp.]|uniref:energy-coupling factor ABC transporter substrate-binding protein n=1 Tax=Desulfurispora sp. TaxID=3014275 RepID=UPI00404AC740
MKKNIIIAYVLPLVLVVLLAIIPLRLNSGAEFSGADSQAEQAISTIAPDYQPWFSSLWEPPSGEIESLLFALQAGLGCLVIGYYIGFNRGRKQAGR